MVALLVNSGERNERFQVKKFQVLFLAVAALVLGVLPVSAQLTATNAVSLIESNVVNARDTMVPIAIGALVLFIGIAAGVKFWKRIFGK